MVSPGVTFEAVYLPWHSRYVVKLGNCSLVVSSELLSPQENLYVLVCSVCQKTLNVSFLKVLLFSVKYIGGAS